MNPTGPNMSFGAIMLTLGVIAIVSGLFYATVSLVPGLDTSVVPRAVSRPVSTRRTKRNGK